MSGNGKRSKLGLEILVILTSLGGLMLLLYFVICFIRTKRKTGDGYEYKEE